MSRSIRIGTRGSDLALWQANHVFDILNQMGHEAEITVIKTKGDKITDLSFDKIEGKGFFTKEIEDRLLTSDIDLAVHSYKDLETEQPFGLHVAATLERGVSEDILLIRTEKLHHNRVLGLAEGAIVGTSSVRRKAQLQSVDEKVVVKDLRGNVPTRIAKLRTGEYDAIVLARAGVERLELNVEDLTTLILDPREFVPAPAQGALALQIRSEDVGLKSILDQINHGKTAECVAFERMLLNKMDGGCHLPLGASCAKEGSKFLMHVFYADQVQGPASFFQIEGSNSEMIEGIENLVESLKS